ncbi:hypothetical protein FACS1894127_1940 [Clostridia bacterium]|nr:hypothetical protein FACS1894127_1940 [Clostridia bacterium]
MSGSLPDRLMSEEKSMFRKVSLDRLSSPEQLDKIITVVSPVGWAAIIALALLIVASLAWGYFGIISNKVSGSGVIMYSDGIVKITSNGSGRVSDINVRGGDYVEDGQVIAHVVQEELEQEIKKIEENITALEKINVESLDLDIDSLNNDIYSEFVQLAGEIRNARVLLDVQKAESEKNQQDVVHQRERLAQQISELNRQIATLQDAVLRQLQDDLEKAKKKLEEETVLFDSGAISKNEFDTYVKDVSLIEERIAARLKSIGAGNTNSSGQSQSRPEFDSQLESLRLQLTMAETDYAQLGSAYTEYIWGAYNQTGDRISSLTEQFSQRRQVIMQDYSKRLKDLKNQYSDRSVITAKSSGVVSGLTVQPNDFVQIGDVVGNIVRSGQTSGNLDVILYVPLDKGKQVEAGMDVNISPTTANREEHGYIIGRVVSVSASSVTQESMMSILQNMQLVQAFSRDTAVIEVEVELLRDGGTTSGYKWSTPRGAPFAIRFGTVCGGEIVVSNQKPIEKVVPFFKKLFL